MKKASVIGLFLTLLALDLGCAQNSNATSRSNQQPLANEPQNSKEDPQPLKLANPASLHCIQNSGKLEIMTGDGGQFGVCLFSDGTRCEEWRFFRKECTPGQCLKPSGICK